MKPGALQTNNKSLTSTASCDTEGMNMLYGGTFFSDFSNLLHLISFAFIIFVMILTGIELIFSKVVCMGLRFGFVPKKMLIIRFSYC